MRLSCSGWKVTMQEEPKLADWDQKPLSYSVWPPSQHGEPHQGLACHADTQPHPELLNQNRPFYKILDYLKAHWSLPSH